MKKITTVVTMLLVALLVFVGCSPNPDNHSIPDWLADKTFSGEVTMTMNGSVEPMTQSMTLRFTDNDCYITQQGMSGQSSLKSSYGTYKYEEKSSDSQYSFIIPHISSSTNQDGVTSNITGSLSFVVDKIDDVTIKLTQKIISKGEMSSPEVTTPIDANITISGTLVRE